MKIGYARVSKTDQNLEMQTDALKAAGVEKIYNDRLSGAKEDRTGLTEMMKVLRKGDSVVVWRLDRLARSMQHLIELVQTFDAAGVQLVSLTEGIDTTTSTGRLVFHIFGSIAEFERNLIIERTNAGLAAARARGKFGGRRRALDADKLETVNKMIAEAREQNADPDYRKIGHIVGASERTIRRVANGEYR
jgi:DNA invertase Pin-like site-specific DNA recombinase